MEQQKGRTAEIIRFALTGGICFLVELAVLILLKGRLGIDTLIATPVAFLVSVILNYLLCVVWVFRGAKNRGAGAKAGFLITSVMGLMLNEGLMYVFRHVFGCTELFRLRRRRRAVDALRLPARKNRLVDDLRFDRRPVRERCAARRGRLQKAAFRRCGRIGQLSRCGQVWISRNASDSGRVFFAWVYALMFIMRKNY